MAFQMIVTDVGRAALTNAQNTGTAPLVISQVAIGSGSWAPDRTATALHTEIKRITTVGGQAVADDTVHVTINDSSTDIYTAREFGLYTNTGVLFAIYASVTPLLIKDTAAMLLVASDTQFLGIPVSSITVSGSGFTNPPATFTNLGVVELATLGEMLTGTDTSRVPPVSVLAAFIAQQIYALDGGAPSSLNRLVEIASAIGNDPNFATNVWNTFNTKQPNLGFVPVRQGGGIYQGGEQINIGWDGAGIRAFVAGWLDLGRVWTNHLVAWGEQWIKFPTGHVLQWGYFNMAGGPSGQWLPFNVNFPNRCDTLLLTNHENIMSDSDVNVVRLLSRYVNGGNIFQGRGNTYTGFDWLALGI